MPAIRKLDPDARGRITVRCTRQLYRDGSSEQVRCGTVFTIEVEALAEDTGDAA